MTINHSCQCSVQLSSPASWCLLMSWCCTFIVSFSTNVFPCQSPLENNCPPNTPSSHLVTSTWKKGMKKGKLTSSLEGIYYLRELPYILSSFSCTASSAALSPPRQNPSWGAESAVCSFCRRKCSVVHEQVDSHRPCLYSPISVRGIRPEEHKGILTLSWLLS